MNYNIVELPNWKYDKLYSKRNKTGFYITPLAEFEGCEEYYRGFYISDINKSCIEVAGYKSQILSWLQYERFNDIIIRNIRRLEKIDNKSTNMSFQDAISRIMFGREIIVYGKSKSKTYLVKSEGEVKEFYIRNNEVFQLDDFKLSMKNISSKQYRSLGTIEFPVYKGGVVKNV